MTDSTTPRPKTVLRYGSDFPFSVGESAIQHAVDVVEGMGASVHLTDAVILLGKAHEKVADFIENVPVIEQAAPSVSVEREALAGLVCDMLGHRSSLGHHPARRDAVTCQQGEAIADALLSRYSIQEKV